MLVCLGAALTMLLGEYNACMLEHNWSEAAQIAGLRTDVTRVGAQVINGIGFLGAGTILVTGHQEVKGLTTAAGLWASACLGLAIGVGFYECFLPAFIMILATARLLLPIERRLMVNARNLNLYIEFQNLSDIGPMIHYMKAQNVRIYEVDIQQGGEQHPGQENTHPSAVFSIRLNRKQPHAEILAAISSLDHVLAIDEI